MLKKKLLIALTFFSISGQAQVGINTATPNAQLDIRATNQATPSNTDGMLIPKVDVFPATPPTAAQQGMLVFLTTASGSNEPGFYYWNNPTTTWIGVGSGTANQWNLTGNSNTSAATNFIGTTNNQDLVFRRNNELSGRIADNNAFFGRLAGETSTGSRNVYIGAEAGSANTSGQENVFIGRRAGFMGATGSNNTFIGNAAGIQNTSNNNMFIGAFAGNANTTGGGNVFIGNSSGASNDTGGQNTFVGLSTGGNVTGSGNTLLGNGANLGANNLTNASAIGSAAQVNANNAMVLGRIAGVNGSTVSTNVGIGTVQPSAKLDIVSSNGGVLIPRVSLTSVNTAAPVVNPNGGALPEGTLVYNTATAGTVPDNVKPGFYYWNGSRWIRFDVNAENVPRYYSAVGTSNAMGTVNYTPMPEMTITFTPTTNVAYVNFSGAGFNASNSACQEFGVFFQILVNGVPAKSWQTTTELAANASPGRPQWDTSILTPVALTPGVPQTISIQWGIPSCNIVFNALSITPFAATGFSYVAHRTLTVIDPNGGGGVVGSTPTLADSWSVNGNTITSSVTSFLGTANNQDLTFRRNGVFAGRLGTSNTSFGVDALSSGTGSLNTAYGNNALAGNAGGSANVAMGFDALASNTLGSGNVAIGRSAMMTNNSGGSNTAIGSIALEDNVSGAFNTAIGSGALANNTTANSNTAVGRATLTTNTIGTQNTAIGSGAMTLNVSGSHNTAIGYEAMIENTTGDENIAIGTSALSRNTVGTGSVAIGQSALANLSFANGGVAFNSRNTAVGYLSLATNNPTTINNGINNSAFGAEALTANTTGTDNTAIGAIALRNNTTGYDNAAVGKSALEANTTGFGNIAVGPRTLESNTTGDANVAMGRDSLGANTTGSVNVAIGNVAMNSNTTGGANTAMGNLVMTDNTTGSNNTAIGMLSLQNNTTGTGNTAIGYDSLASIGAGTDNTGLGAHTSTTSAILTNATAVGSRATVATSNALVLGSVNGVNGATSSVNVGIGTTSPSTRLDVADENAVTTIGVEGNLNIRTNDDPDIDIGGSLTLGGRISTSTTTRNFASIEGRKANATSGSGSGYLALKTSTGTVLAERLRITSLGDVGIGTATPGGQFELSLNEGRKPGTNTWTIVSDARLKNITGDYTKGLDEIIKLRPITYRYKSVGNRIFEEKVTEQEFSGFLAQDVQKIFPESVGTDRDGYLNFDIHSILVAQVNAIRELKERNDMLNDEVRQLKAQLISQEEILERLKKLESKQ